VAAPGGGDLSWGAVGQPGVGPVVGVPDVGADLGAGVFDGLPFRAPGAAHLELAEPGLDERLGFGIARATTSVGDAAVGR